MIKVRILSVGKTKEDWLEAAIFEYLKRMQNEIEIEFIWLKNDSELIQQASKERLLLALDPKGDLLTSEQFANRLQDAWVKGGSKIAFVIGGPDGLPQELKQKPLISLSRMTFTHQITRLILIEQLYRAWTLVRGLPYHK